MDSPNEPGLVKSGGSARSQAPRRRFQFRLLTLFLLTALCAVGLFAWRTIADALPYREQPRTAALIAELGGSYQTAEASGWHRRLFGSSLQNLVLVNLADCDRPEDYINPVAGLPKLETPVVGGEAFTDRHLSRLHGAASLRHLVLDSTAVTDDGVEALKTALPKVEVYVSERRAIAILSKVAYVTTNAEPAPEALRQAVGDAFFVTCRSACCSHKAQAVIAQVRHLKRVERLVLGHVPVGDAELAHVKGLTTLRELIVGDGPVTDAGIANLAGLSQLKRLDLSRAPIGDAGLAHLGHLTALEFLDLDSTQIADQGLAHLTTLKRLEHLRLDDTRCTHAAIERLGQALPQCSISDDGLLAQ